MAATVDVIAESDIADVAAFLARQTRAGEAIAPILMTPERRLRWLLLENPCRASDIPLGWRIRDDAGAVVGAAICIPYRIGAGSFSATALMFAKFFVDRDYRGMGLGIFMRFVREGRRFPLFCSSTNAISGDLFSRLGGKMMPGMDHTMLGVARPRPLMEEWLYRRTGRRLLARFLSMPAMLAPGRIFARNRIRDKEGRLELRRLNSAGDVVALNLPALTDALAISRDRDYLQWRYFSGESQQHVYCLCSEGQRDRMVVVNEVRSGYRGQIRVLNVLDVWPPADAQSAATLATALANQYRGCFDTKWLRSQPPEAEEALEKFGFVRHNFPAHLGWFIDGESKLPTDNWYVMPGESE